MTSPATFLSGPLRPAPVRRLAWRRTWSFRLAMLFAGGVWAGGAMAATPEPAVSKEYQIKAAFLYNFTKFVEWPSQRFADAAAPIVIGVLGKNPFGDELEKIVRNRKVNGRGIAIVYFSSAVDAKAAHAVFIGAGEEKRLGRQLESLVRGAVLVVGESERMAALGGMVTFTTTGDKVRFEINMIPAEQAGLKISSQLQKLATVVRRKP